MEKGNRKKADGEVARRIGRMYGVLHDACRKYAPSLREFDDIFQDTVLYVIFDREAPGQEPDSSFASHFVFRFKLILFRTTKNEQQQKQAEITYASNQQTKQAEE